MGDLRNLPALTHVRWGDGSQRVFKHYRHQPVGNDIAKHREMLQAYVWLL